MSVGTGLLLMLVVVLAMVCWTQAATIRRNEKHIRAQDLANATEEDLFHVVKRGIEAENRQLRLDLGVSNRKLLNLTTVLRYDADKLKRERALCESED